MATLKILFFGDIFGKMGRKGIIKEIDKIKKQYQPDLIIANAENLAHGHGVTESSLKEMTDAGIDIFTSGNHVWDKRDAFAILNKKDSPIIRPANYPEGTAGKGEIVFKIGLKSILVVNLIGRVFFKESFDCPFKTIDKILEKYKQESLQAIIVDIHAEATSEKKAMGFYLDGRVSAVLGTHTHVMTADEQTLEKGTAYITDIGMTGSKDSVIGLDKTTIIKNFITQINESAEVHETGTCLINGVYLEIDPKTSQAIKIERINLETEV